MIDFRGDDTGLFLIYGGENEPDLMWALRRLRSDPPLRIRKCFFFEPSDLVQPKMVLDEAEATDGAVVVSDRSDDRYEGEFTFKIGEVDGEYFRLSSSALRTKHRFFVHRDIRLDARFFVATF